MMRWAMVALVLSAGIATAQPPRQQQQDGWASKAFIDDNKPVSGHDFGVIPAGTQLHHDFKMKNLWGVPLKIQTAVSCGCVKVTLAKEVLQKNEAGTLQIDMDGRSFQGHKAVNVFVTLVEDSPRPKFQSTATLVVTANARVDVTLNPGAVNFGIVTAGQPVQKQFVDVDYAGRLQWQITGVPKSDLFDISVLQRINAPGRIGYQVGLAVKPDAPVGKKKDELTLQTNDPASPTVAIPFEITILPRLQAPEVVKATGAKVGAETMSGLVVIQSPRPFKITGFNGLGNGLDLGQAIAKDARPIHYAKFKLTPTQAGTYSQKVTVNTDDPTMTATITVEAEVAK